MNEEDLIETKLTLELWGDSVIDSMRNILISNSKSASGNLINSLNYTITFNGVDLDIEYYGATPNTVANVIISLKKKLGLKIVMVSP